MKRKSDYNSNNNYDSTKALEVCQYMLSIASEMDENYFNRGIATTVVGGDMIAVVTDDIKDLEKMYKDVKDEYYYIKKLNQNMPYGSDINVTIDKLMGLCDEAINIVNTWSKHNDLKKCTDEEIYLLESKLEENYQLIKRTSRDIEDNVDSIIRQINSESNNEEQLVEDGTSEITGISRLKKINLGNK